MKVIARSRQPLHKIASVGIEITLEILSPRRDMAVWCRFRRVNRWLGDVTKGLIVSVIQRCRDLSK